MGEITTESLFSGQVVRFTLNAPKANVLDAEMMMALQSELEETGADVKLIQFTGAGDHFSFGASVPEHSKENAPEMLRHFHGLFLTLIDLATPTMALVSGQCLGGGLELAIMCNFLFVDKSAKLGQPEISLGVFAPPASLILPMKIGQARADDLLLTGRSMTAEEALTAGLVTEIFDDRQTMLGGADEWIQKQILPKSASSLKFAVRAARRQFNATLKSELSKLAKFYTDELMASHDASEGIASFMEKRKAEWKDR